MQIRIQRTHPQGTVEWLLSDQNSFKLCGTIRNQRPNENRRTWQRQFLALRSVTVGVYNGELYFQNSPTRPPRSESLFDHPICHALYIGWNHWVPFNFRTAAHVFPRPAFHGVLGATVKLQNPVAVDFVGARAGNIHSRGLALNEPIDEGFMGYRFLYTPSCFNCLEFAC
jgi:hypothetical protein